MDNEEDEEDETKISCGYMRCKRPALGYKRDSVRSWIVCAAGVTCNIIIYGSLNSFGILYPSLLDEFKQGKAKTAWVGSLAMALTCLFGPIGGTLGRRFEPRLVASCGALLSALGFFLTSRVHKMWIMFLTYGIIVALGSSFVYTTVFGIVPRYFYKRRALATGMIAVGPGAGIFLISQVLEVSVSAFGWRGALAVIAGIEVSMCGLVMLFDPNVEDSSQLGSRCGKVWGRSEGQHKLPLWRNKPFVIYNVLGPLVLFGSMIPQVHMARYCEDLGFTLKMASRLYLAFGIASMAGRVFAGQISDLPSVNPRYICQTGAFGMGLAIILSPLARDFSSLIVDFTICGIFEGLFAAAYNILILGTTTEDEYGSAMGVAMAIMSIGLASGPPIGGLIAERFGSYVPVFLVAGSTILVASFIPFLLEFWKDEEPSNAVELQSTT